MAFIKEESEEMMIEETLRVKHEDVKIEETFRVKHEDVKIEETLRVKHEETEKETDGGDMDSYTDSICYSGSESSLEVEDFSPPDSPESYCEHIDDNTGPMPYQFEPLGPYIGLHTGESEDKPDEAQIEDVSHWCSCGNCSRLSLGENVCCKDIPQVMHRCAQVDGVVCITDHPGFEPVTLNPYVLQAVYGTYRQYFGEMRNPTLSSSYRHLADRNFVRWCWGYLSRHIRVVIPSCAVTRIRQQFSEQSENYTGFLPPLE